MSYNLFLDSDRTRSFLLYANTIGYWYIAILVILAVLVERNIFTEEPIYETQQKCFTTLPSIVTTREASFSMQTLW